jgi:glycosyltransferase involved in cell wall biosynthesis
MRVLLDTSYAARGPSGTAVYIERLAEALRERDGIELIEARQPRRLRRGGRNPLRSAVNAALDFVWLHRGLPRAARAARADVVHHPLPAYSPRIPASQVATVHDVAILHRPGDYGRVWGMLARRAYRRAARRCDALVCVSEAVAGQVSARRVVVAHHGPGQGLPGVERAEQPRHFLYVGDDEPRKNLDGLLGAYEHYRAGAERPLELVLAGGAARRVGGEVSPSAARLAELHSAAAALVHPSLEEGFGLTLLEAMAAGTPVIAVRTTAAEEVCGDAALLVEPKGLADALARIAAEPELRERLAATGRERAKEFSWDESARLHVSAYTLAHA